MLKLTDAIDFALSLVFPERCIVCDRVIGMGDDGVCKKCRGLLPFIREPHCVKCGRQIENERKEYCADCERTIHIYDRGRCLLTYDENISKSIYRFKYAGRQRYAIFYGNAIADEMAEEIRSWGADAIVPVPLHKKRLKKRGYNQAMLVARQISKRLEIPVREDLIFRCVNTKVMKILSPLQRQNNLKKAFKIGVNSVKCDTIILVDDIYTTGSTIDAVSDVLKHAGVKHVYFLAVATGRSQ